MKCMEVQEKLVAYLEGVIDPGAAEEVSAHLESCAACQAVFGEHRTLRERLARNGRRLAAGRLDVPVMDRIFREQTVRLRGEAVRTRFISLCAGLVAAAAVLVIALWLFELTSTVSFDQKDGSSDPKDGTQASKSVVFGPKIDDWELAFEGETGMAPRGATRPIIAPQAKAPVNTQAANELLKTRLRSLGYTANPNTAVPYKPGPGDTVPPGDTATFMIITEGKPLRSHFTGAEFGFSVGGAKDVGNFRENIAKGFLPLPTDVVVEGLFYDYFFDTGELYDCDDLFFPTYCAAATKDPFSGKTEYYLSVGMNSGMKSFNRKKLNLMIVLDISGSMKSPFDKYHYDGSSSAEAEEAQAPKIEVAKRSLLALLNHLEDADRFGMAVFCDRGFLAKPLRYVGETDMKSTRQHVKELQAEGSTNMASGMRIATAQYDAIPDADAEEYENRIIFITDAMPNTGEISEQGLLGMARKNAEGGIHTTFIGVGVDFNTELVQSITKTRGANYYSVHSPMEFEKRMDEEFEFMVTPLVFGLELVLESGGWQIDKVYGSPEADEATGSLMKMNTLFPSKRVEGRTRGGVVLLKLSRKSEPTEDEILLSVKYEDRMGKRYKSTRTIRFDDKPAERFTSTGIRKAVVLTRYANLLKNWLIDARKDQITFLSYRIPMDDYIVTWDGGIIIPPKIAPSLGRWERQSRPLDVNDHYEKLFDAFMGYFKAETEALDDETLKQEVEVLEGLTKR